MTLWAKAGVSCDYVSFEDEELHEVIYTHKNFGLKAEKVLRAFFRRFALLPRLKNYDVVFIYEEAARLGPAIVERLIARTRIPIVYDFCDPIYLPYKSPRNHYFSYLKCFGKTAAICKMSAHVLVGNRDLFAYAQQHNPHCTIVPITIDTEEYTPRDRADQQGALPIIGWSGSHTTVPHLDGLKPVLEHLRKERAFRLKVIGATAYAVAGVDVEAIRWRAATEVEDLSGIDIGIMPLPDDPWTRLRTHLKVRQYMGLGIPLVASPVGVNSEIIGDGVNGFLAATPDEWIDKLKRLLDDGELRKTMGARARKTIEEQYSANVWAPRVLAIMDRVVREARSARR
jgi:glycosyltransferase involved in cell wall biosynthesis